MSTFYNNIRASIVTAHFVIFSATAFANDYVVGSRGAVYCRSVAELQAFVADATRGGASIYPECGQLQPGAKFSAFSVNQKDAMVLGIGSIPTVLDGVPFVFLALTAEAPAPERDPRGAGAVEESISDLAARKMGQALGLDAADTQISAECAGKYIAAVTTALAETHIGVARVEPYPLGVKITPESGQVATIQVGIWSHSGCESPGLDLRVSGKFDLVALGKFGRDINEVKHIIQHVFGSPITNVEVPEQEIETVIRGCLQTRPQRPNSDGKRYGTQQAGQNLFLTACSSAAQTYNKEWTYFHFIDSK